MWDFDYDKHHDINTNDNGVDTLKIKILFADSLDKQTKALNAPPEVQKEIKHYTGGATINDYLCEVELFKAIHSYADTTELRRVIDKDFSLIKNVSLYNELYRYFPGYRETLTVYRGIQYPPMSKWDAVKQYNESLDGW